MFVGMFSCHKHNVPCQSNACTALPGPMPKLRI